MGIEYCKQCGTACLRTNGKLKPMSGKETAARIFEAYAEIDRLRAAMKDSTSSEFFSRRLRIIKALEELAIRRRNSSGTISVLAEIDEDIRAFVDDLIEDEDHAVDR